MKDIIKDTVFNPLTKARIDSLPRAIAFWKVTPRCSTAGNPDNSVKNGMVTLGWVVLICQNFQVAVEKQFDCFVQLLFFKHTLKFKFIIFLSSVVFLPYL